MRTFTILLLLLNLAFATWQQGWLGNAPAAAPSLIRLPFRQAPQALVMLAELPADQRALMDQISLAEARVTNAQQQLAGVELQAASARGQLSGDEVTQSVADPALDQDQSPPEQALVAPVVPWCAEAGPFADQPAATVFVDAVNALGVSSETEARQVVVSSTWSVYLPPFADEAEARRVLDELQGKGIDSFYIREGDFAGGISLGVFSREASALSARAERQRQGYEASVREIERLGERVFVTVAMPDSAMLITPEWADFQASAGDVQVSEKLCEVIAQQNVFP